jgi:hypothetical protein
MICLEVIKTGIQCIPFVMQRAVPNDVLLQLAKYVVHVDKVISEKAYSTLYTLITTRPDLRPAIILATNDFCLSIDEDYHEIIHSMLLKVYLSI